MNAHVKFALILGSLVLTSPSLATAKPVAPTAQLNGTWRLNMAHSKFSTPGDRRETRTYAITGNKVKLESSGTDAKGKPVKYHFSAAYDGKYYSMVGNPVGDSIALTLVDSRHVKAKVRRNKMMSATSATEISADGKHLTLSRRTLHAKGAETVDVLAYDKVE